MAGIIVFGRGYLGTRIAEALDYTLAPKFDVTDSKTLRAYLDDVQPEAVIDAIGKTGKPNIDWCETHKEETMHSNVEGALALGIACSEKDIYFAHLSSGCIYVGDNGGKGYKEDDEPNFFGPQFYAKTKILAEKVLRELPGKVLQARIRMPIDDRPHPRSLIDKLRGYSRVVDVQNSMTTVPDMILALEGLIEKRASGIYNLTNPGTISAAEIMKMYMEIIDPNHSFEVIGPQELDRITVSRRSNCLLNTDKLKSEGLEMTEIHEAVRKCLTNYRRFL